MTIDDPPDLSKTARGASIDAVDDLIPLDEQTPALRSVADADAEPETAQPEAPKPLAPPNPPAPDTKDEPSEERAPASIPAPRARVISVGGGSSPPIPSGTAAAWTRPSETPGARSNPQHPIPEQKLTAPPVDLRAKLGIPRLKGEPASAVPDAASADRDGPRIVPMRVPTSPGSPAPAALRADAPKPASDPVIGNLVTPRRSPPPPVPSVAAPAAAPRANTGAGANSTHVQPSPPGERAAPPLEKPTRTGPSRGPSELPFSEPRTPPPAVRGRSEDPSPSRISMDPSLFDAVGARPRSEPARLRSGSARPRGSSPGVVARSQGTPPRPLPGTPNSPSGAAGGVQRGDVPGPPRVPNFALSAGASHARPESSVPRKSEPPVTASAIAVMRIIAVGSPKREPPVIEVDDDLLEEDTEHLETVAERELPSAPRASAPRAVAPQAEVLEELADEDIAPDSADPVDASPALRAANRVRREKAKAPPPVPPSAREVEVPKPPPPPARSKNPNLPKALPQAKRKQKRPWWEDVFGEDFVRTTFRYTDDQVRREADFIEEALGVASGGVVLDLGCGPGHHAVELTSRGYGVVGYDLSLYQLALASEVAHERGQKLNFLQGDMREMAFEEMFDGIFSWNTSFGYFEEEKNVHVVERVFRALRPGGMFLLDVVNRDFVAASSPCQLWYEGDACVCMDDMNLDFITSRMCVKRSIILDDGRTRELVYSIRVYSLHELGKILHDVGFRVTEASGHPSTPGVFFGEHSPRIIILAQKP